MDHEKHNESQALFPAQSTETVSDNDRQMPIPDGTNLPVHEEDGRLRYLARQGLPAAPVDTGSKLDTPRKRKRWKRWFLTISMPFVLAIAGLFVFSLIGETGLIKAYSIIGDWWLPATVFRLTLYLALATLAWPVMMGKFKAQARENLAARHALMAEQGVLDHDAMLDLNLSAARIEQARIPGWAVMLFCLVLELLFVQLPFYLLQQGMPS